MPHVHVSKNETRNGLQVCGERQHECDFGGNSEERILGHLISERICIQKCISRAWTLQFLSEASQIEDIAGQVHDVMEYTQDFFKRYVARTTEIEKAVRTIERTRKRILKTPGKRFSD